MNAKDPSRGFQYLYLSDKDYQAIAEKANRLPLKASSVIVGGNVSNLYEHTSPGLCQL